MSKDRAYRRLHGEYVCDGAKLLAEAVLAGADVSRVLWCSHEQRLEAGIALGQLEAAEYLVSREMITYVSPLKNSPGPLFTIRIPEISIPEDLQKVIILEGVQDPGNIGTVIRTANAFSIDAVILTDGCADLYNPKTVRSAMGALLHQQVLELPLQETIDLMEARGLPIYGAALGDSTVDIRRAELYHGAAAIGSEGSGLSQRLIEACRCCIKIPMDPKAESLNAAVAASIVMWEMSKSYYDLI